MDSGPRAVQSVTTAPESLAAEQSSRIRRYLITMGIRTTCFVAAIPLQGWMRWTSVAMAVLLPYVAVVLANAVRPRPDGTLTPVAPVVEQLTRDRWEPTASGAERETLDGSVVPSAPAQDTSNA